MLTVLITQLKTSKNWLLTSKTKTMNQKRLKTYKFLNAILESVGTIVSIGAGTIVSIGAKSISINLSITGFGLNILPMTAKIACTLKLGNKKKNFIG